MRRKSGRKDTGRRNSDENRRSELAVAWGECRLHRLTGDAPAFADVATQGLSSLGGVKVAGRTSSRGSSSAAMGDGRNSMVRCCDSARKILRGMTLHRPAPGWILDLHVHGRGQQVPPLRFPFPAGKRSFGRNDKVYWSCYLLLSFLIPDEERRLPPQRQHQRRRTGVSDPHGQHQKQKRRAFGPRTAEGGLSPHSLLHNVQLRAIYFRRFVPR